MSLHYVHHTPPPSPVFHVPGGRAVFCPLSSVLCLLVLLFANANADAGTISISSRVTLSVTGNHLTGSLRVTNLGTAPAHRLRAEVSLPREVLRTATKSRLGPGESVTFPVEAAIEKLRTGRHPATILTRFQDDKGYPFTAITCATFSYGESPEGVLRAIGEPLVMKETGTVRFRVENSGARAVAVTATLVVPREIEAGRRSTDLLIRGGSTWTLGVPLTNLSALQGATYPVFAVMEYDLDDRHYTTVGHALVKIPQGGNGFRRTRWWWAGGFLVLLGAFGVWRVLASGKR